MRRHDRQEICKYFQNFSETYIEDVHDYSSGTKYLSKIELEFVLKNCLIKKKARVLEIGIGTGRIANVLSGKGATVDGIDISKKMLEKAEKNLKGKCVSLKVADAGERLPYPNDTFDYVICIRVLKYIQRWKNAIKETFRVLNKNGIFIFDIANLYSVAYLGSRNANYRLFKPAEVMETLKREGFKIVKMKPSSRLPFPLYQRVNNRTFLNILTKIERLMSTILPPTLLSRSILVAVKAQTI